MAIDALTRRSDGTEVSASDDPTEQWVSAAATRSHALGDPLLDWLDRHGDEHGYLRDDDPLRSSPPYDPRTDFDRFWREQQQRFQRGVAHLLRDGGLEIVRVSAGSEDARNLGSAVATFEAMQAGAAAIQGGVLWDAATLTSGAPTLLVRSDVLQSLFPSALTEEAAAVGADDLSGDWHYRVLAVEFMTLRLNVRGMLRGGGAERALQTRLFVENRALGRLQGYEPAEAFVLGRSWEQRIGGQPARGSTCLERLGQVPQDGRVSVSRTTAAAVSEATEWLRTMRREGADWRAAPLPSVPELHPNLSNRLDAPWHATKHELAGDLGELTMLPGVDEARRANAHAAGIFDWREQRCTPETLGFHGQQANALAELLEVNRTTADPAIRPARVIAASDVWRSWPPLEFYVDVQAVSDLGDDGSSLPQRGGYEGLFLVSCGHVEYGRWKWMRSLAGSLDADEEASLLDRWFKHMAAARERLAPDGDDPLVIVWPDDDATPADEQVRAALGRHPERSWPEARWFNFREGVAQAEPLVARGSFGFGLEATARAFHEAGAIETTWDESAVDGPQAMVAAWRAQETASRGGAALEDNELLQQVVSRSEARCRAMMEIIRHLRTSH